MNQLARAEARGKNGARHAPVIALRPFGLIDQARAGKYARHVRTKAQSAKSAEYIATCSARGFLQIQ